MAFHVDDYQIRWKNFRAFKDTGWLTIRPLTVLIGPNNAGKTSILSPLLIMSQTVRSPDTQTPLISRGPLVDSGVPQNLFHNDDLSGSIYFGFKFHLHSPEKKIRPIGEYPPGVLELTFNADKKRKALQLKQFRLLDAFDRHLLTKHKLASGRYKLTSNFIGKMKKTEQDAAESTQPNNFHFSPNSAIQFLRKKNERLDSDFSRNFSKYLSCLAFEFGDVTSTLRRLTYIGPMRERLARFYEVSGETPESVGVSGEQMANIIRRNRSQIGKDLNTWIRRFEFGKSIELEESQNRMLFSLLFDSGIQGIVRRNIADSGFGVSQVLPLIVQALTAQKETLTIAEQPEIHLNPKLQCTLADLFVEMANTDHRVIVETHSEHLLLRLRTLIAGGKISRDKVAIYFVEKTDGTSTVRHVNVNDDGSIKPQDWPTGFFAESLRESFALAAEQSRARKLGSTNSAQSNAK